MYAACFLSFCTGFLSLSLEILWIRLFSFTNHSLPHAFAFVVSLYLIGIALGAVIGKQFCRQPINLWLVSGVFLILSSFSDFITPWIYVYFSHGKWQLIIGAIMIVLTALWKAIIFPIAHHLGTPPSTTHTGRHISRVYVSNILGSTLGPLCTGILLLSFITTQQAFFACAGLTLGLALYCLQMILKPLTLTAFTTTTLFIILCTFSLNPHSLIAMAAAKVTTLKNIVENQYGIVTVYQQENNTANGDIIYGGNVYDGRTNLNPMINSNGINRLLILAALQEHPRHVLMIGLSIGTWLKLLTTFPGIEKIDVIEINPGYLQAMQQYPQLASGLQDKRVHFYIDDGRRWLKNHPHHTYDLIVMNTTYHWRAYVDNLLSTEFISLLKQHMNPEAILAYNSTDSADALKTAMSVFHHAYWYTNFIIAANFDWRKKLLDNNAVNKLAALKLDGKFLFPAKDIIHSWLNLPLNSLDKIEPFYNAFGRRVEIITDKNLITEYKYGRQLSPTY